MFPLTHRFKVDPDNPKQSYSYLKYQLKDVRALQWIQENPSFF